MFEVLGYLHVLIKNRKYWLQRWKQGMIKVVHFYLLKSVMFGDFRKITWRLKILFSVIKSLCKTPDGGIYTFLKTF